MIRRKFYLFLVLLFLFIGFARYASAQFIADPGDRIYRFITIWEGKGLLSRLPLIRPYPLQLIERLLREVEDKGGPADREIARGYYAALFVPSDSAEAGRKPSAGESPEEQPEQKPEEQPEEKLKAESSRETPSGDVVGPADDLELQGKVHLDFSSAVLTEFSDVFWQARGRVDTTGALGPYFSFSGLFAYSLIDDPGEEFYARGVRFRDESETGGGVLRLGSLNIGMGQLGLGCVGIGSDRYYFQAGLMRTSVGPFFDNGPIVGPQATAAGHFSLTLAMADWLTLSSLYLELAGEYKEDVYTGTAKRIGEPVKKYFVLHTANFYPFSWMSFGFVQAIVAGNHLNPAYFIPFQHTFFTQQLYGDWDSSILGLYTRFNLPYWFQIDALMYVDDWDAFSSEEKQAGTGFNLDSAQNKYALQIGVSWNPSFHVFRRVSLDYILITPYMYTHSAHAKVDYLSYTHAGRSLGSTLEPNSDQLSLKAYLTPLDWLDLHIWSRFSRHGNASENYDRGDGGYYDDGFYDGGYITFYGPSRFLTQRTIEYTLQVAVDFGLHFSFEWGVLHVDGGYLFEHVWNTQLQSGVNDINHHVHLGVRLRLFR